MADEAGYGCVARAYTLEGYTWVSYGHPADISGNVDRLGMYADPDYITDTVRFAFFTASGNNLTTVSGTRTAAMEFGGTGSACYEFNAPGDFTAFPVSAGEYLGGHTPIKQYYDTSGGADIWYTSGDHTDASSYAFDYEAGVGDALTADITAAGGISIPVVMHHLTKNIASGR